MIENISMVIGVVEANLENWVVGACPSEREGASGASARVVS